MSEVTLETLAEQQKLTHQLILETTQIIYDRLDRIKGQIKVLNWTTETTADCNIGMAIAMQEMQNEMADTLPAFTPEHNANLYTMILRES